MSMGITCNFVLVCGRWTRTLQQQSIGCSTGGLAVGVATMRILTLVGTVSFWFSTWTLTQNISSGSVPAERVELSGARGASHRRDTPHWQHMASEDLSLEPCTAHF